VTAGNKKGDQMHDGMGFLTQHIALTADYEVALRAVDAAVTVPYWDFTYDRQLLEEDLARPPDVKRLWELDVWKDDWFGNASGSKYHTIERGRFAFQDAGLSRASVSNPYGLLRSPWNMNKSPWLTRVHKLAGTSFPLTWWPSCASHHSLTHTSTTLINYTKTSLYAPHGPVHTMVGGYYMSGDLLDRFRGILDEAAIGKFAEYLVQTPKTLYRNGDASTVRFPEYCSADSEQTSCHMICYEDETEIKEGHNYSGSLFTTIKRWMNDDFLDGDVFLAVLCTTPWAAGEQLESGSPADPSFWPIHPTMDRLLQYKRLARPFLDLTWNNTDDVCQSEHSDGCKGHHSYDATSFNARLRQADGSYLFGSYTNGEILDATDPNDYQMDYIYDTFEWSHCDKAGWYFKALEWDG